MIPKLDTPSARLALAKLPAVEKGVHTLVQGPRAVVLAEYLAVADVYAKQNPLHLKIAATAGFSDGTLRELEVLLDTGSEVNIIRKGLVPPHFCIAARSQSHS